jgi:excisionase family DNA binding protein
MTAPAGHYRPKNRADALEYIAFLRDHYGDTPYPDDYPSLKDWPHLAPAPMPDDPNTLATARQAAQHLNITVEQLLALVHDGTLRAINISRGKKRGRWRFTRADLDQFKASRIRQEQQPCRFTSGKPVRTTISTSSSKVIGFAELQARRLAAKRTLSKPLSGTKPKRW